MSLPRPSDRGGALRRTIEARPEAAGGAAAACGVPTDGDVSVDALATVVAPAAVGLSAASPASPAVLLPAETAVPHTAAAPAAPAAPRRKGARSFRTIPPEVREGLDRGEIESASLAEFLAVDRLRLFERVLTACGRAAWFPAVAARTAALRKPSFKTIHEAVAAALAERIAAAGDAAVLSFLASHPSDTVRSVAACVTARIAPPAIGAQLAAIRPFAADRHFTVRECAWSGVREAIIRELPEALALLARWAADPDANIRRFASEATRPRGVWCLHIEALKAHPEAALPLLEPLRSDPSPYVRASVGNWLNDASKSRPAFVRALCDRWLRESDTAETRRIVRRALRTIGK